MKGRLPAILAIILIGGAPALAPQAGAASGGPLLYMGYGPSSLFAVSQGTPVYTAGDQLWLMSNYGSTVTVEVVEPVGQANSSAPLVREAVPGVPTRVMTFNASTPQGLWQVRSTGQTFPPAAFMVSDAEKTPARLSLSAYRLSKGSLLMNFTASSTTHMYGEDVCVLGGGDPSAARVSIPAKVGTGYVSLARDGDSLEARLNGSLAANSSLLVELHRAFSFLSPNSTSIFLSREATVAATPSVLFTGAPVPLSLAHDLPLAPGTYQVRAFFEGPAGLFLSTTSVLVTGGSWIWLGACRSFPAYSSTFGYPDPLSGPSSWPRSVWLTYGTLGEEGVANLTLGVEVSEASFVGAPWGVKLSNYTFSVRSSSGVEQTGGGNGSIFAVLNASSGRISYGAGLGGRPWFNGTTGPLLPFATTTVSLNVSRVEVTYLVGGSPYHGGRVQVSDPSGTLASATTDAQGRATFYLPTGSYGVTAVGGNESASGSVDAVAGQPVGRGRGGGTGSGRESAILVALRAAGGDGAAANVGLWARGRRAGGHPAAKPSQK